MLQLGAESSERLIDNCGLGTARRLLQTMLGTASEDRFHQLAAGQRLAEAETSRQHKETELDELRRRVKAMTRAFELSKTEMAQQYEERVLALMKHLLTTTTTCV